MLYLWYTFDYLSSACNNNLNLRVSIKLSEIYLTPTTTHISLLSPENRSSSSSPKITFQRPQLMSKMHFVNHRKRNTATFLAIITLSTECSWERFPKQQQQQGKNKRGKTLGRKRSNHKNNGSKMLHKKNSQ